MKNIDITNQRFGRLIAIKKTFTRKNKSYWLCKCDCGNEVNVYLNHLKSGHTKSCGCFNKEQISISKKTHGKSSTRIYKIWLDMKGRCYNKNEKAYKDYGGRGITMCDEWINDFVSFYNWAINNHYDSSLSIDRIDNNNGYYPDNCRWVTDLEQSNNKRNNHFIKYKNEEHTIAEWERLLNIRDGTLQARINRIKFNNWTIIDCFEKPFRKSRCNKKNDL